MPLLTCESSVRPRSYFHNRPLPSQFPKCVIPPAMPSYFQFKEPPLPLEFQKAIHGVVWIFSGIAQ